MADLALIAASDDLLDGFDLDFLDTDLLLDPSLRTAVIVSLFSDRENDDAGSADRRGWWGDALSSVAGDRIGSTLWQLQREKQTDDVLIKAQLAAERALAWLVDDGVARSVKATATFPQRGRLDLAIEIVRPTGRELIRFSDIWAASLRPYERVSPFTQLAELQRLAERYAYLYQTLNPMVTL